MSLPFLTNAAPELILTWKANSFVPSGYMGKALPVANTPLDASVILLDNGKVINTAPYEIHWYAGENLIATGKGKTTVRIPAPATGEDIIELRASIPKYSGGAQDAFASIPLVHPEIVIMKSVGSQVKSKGLTTYPYFWNIANANELNILWDDGEEMITARATNKKNPLEFAQTTISKQ